MAPGDYEWASLVPAGMEDVMWASGGCPQILAAFLPFRASRRFDLDETELFKNVLSRDNRIST